MTYCGLRISESYRACLACTFCLGTETPAPVTGAAADEYNLNVVDCDASVTVARLAVLNLSQWGSGGYPQPPEANVPVTFGLWSNYFAVTESSTGPIKRFKEMAVAHVGGHG
jgi:hypothetical protein